MKILTDKEIEEIKPIWSEEYGTARAIEAKVIEKMKARAFKMCAPFRKDRIDEDFMKIFKEQA